MRKAIFAGIAVLLVIALLLPAYAEEPKRPVVLLFNVNAGDSMSKDLAESATKALRNYYRDTERVDVAIFDRESPVVLRAIMDRALSADKVASYASRAERLEVARTLAYAYASGAEVSVMNDNQVRVKLWLGKVDGGKHGAWETTGAASAVGAGARDLDNAMQSAVSMAVISMARQALMSLRRVPQADANIDNKTTAIVKQPGASTQADESGYAAQADDNMKIGNLAVAVQQYSQAINMNPENAPLRIKLADAYVRRNMFDEALRELDRAAALGGDAKAIAAIRNEIETVRGGGTQPVATNIGDKSPTEVSQPDSSKPSDPASAAIQKMRDGDALWRAGKSDEALDAYRESVKLNPYDWRAHERLVVLCVAMSMFGEGRKGLLQLNAVQPDPPQDIIQNRYGLFRKAFDARFSALIKQYDTDSADFEKHRITRESYYNSINGLTLRMDAMTQFLDTMTVPELKKQANLHRSLACGLMAQAASSLLEYLETNTDKAKSDAAVFAQQARKELETAASLESSSM